MDFSTEVSVRHLVEFILRNGDLYTESSSQHTALAGSQIHRNLQKKAAKDNPTYQKEVAFAFSHTIEGTEFTVRGRADGISERDDLYQVDEIKTSETPLDDLSAGQIDLFFAQGMCYAYFLCEEKELATIQVQLVYFEVGENKVTPVLRQFSHEELATFFEDVMAEYYKWYQFVKANHVKLVASTENLKFPFADFRRGQRDLMVVAHKAIQLKKQLFLQAPTGTGKTISTLFPAVLGLGQEKFPRIFYLTAKTITRQVVEEGLDLMRQEKLAVKSITLTAKDKICFGENGRCNSSECPFAKGYYDRVNAGLMDMLAHEDAMTREVIETYARKHTLCPFEFSLDASLFCQVIIGDYNYVYDPLVYLRRFFDEVTPETAPLLLVDEAHNLVDRSKNMYSKQVSLKNCQRAQRMFKDVSGTDALGKKGRRLFNKLLKLLREKRAELTTLFSQQTEMMSDLVQLLLQINEMLALWLVQNVTSRNNELRDWSFEAYGYCAIAELYNEKFVTTFEERDGDFLVTELCLDPSEFLKASNEKCYDTLLFSATLTPVKYYEERLGANDAVDYLAQSPFSPDNQQVIITDYIETTYQKRQGSLDKIIEALLAMLDSQTGNYFVFAPSYAYLKEIYGAFMAKRPEKCRVQIQERQMDEQARVDFLATFREEGAEPVVGFVLLGGIFSEGIDLPEKNLIGSAIVGVGLPQLNPTTDLERDYFQGKNRRGFEFAYQLPGMNKVLQAAGRVIRTPNDFGVVVLLDARFTQQTYRRLLPDEWQIGVAHNLEGLTEGLAQFWHKEK